MVDELSFHVRYAETDQMGRAYYAWYLVWFEAGRSSLMRRAGLSYAELEKRGVFLPVRRAELRYEKGLHYDELITVRSWVKKHGLARMVFASEVLAESGEVACRGEVEVAVTDATGKITRWPDDVLKLISSMQEKPAEESSA